MLTSLLGLRLIWMIGKTVPLPASYELSLALTQVEVTNDADQGDGFQMSFTIGKSGPTDYPLLASGALDPFNRVILGVLLGTTPEVLIDGIITHHQLAPSNDPGASTLTVTGKDLSVLLDLEEKNEEYPNLPDSLIVTQLLAAYAQYGLVPLATPTANIPIEVERIPRQQETDLKFIQRLAERNGYVFYIEPQTFGVNSAYWGPELRASVPQSALTLNMGSATNVNSLQFANDSLAPVATEGSLLEPITKTSIPIPSLPSLRVPPLALAPTEARRSVLLRETANQNATQAMTSAVAAVTRSPDSVTGSGDLDTVRYGHILRARQVVGVRGVGYSYDGNYYVRRVTHKIARGECTQQFALSREGTGALLPVVAP